MSHALPAFWRLHRVHHSDLDFDAVAISEASLSRQFDRAWARVELSHSPRRWYPSRLSITSHGRFVELGHFLTNGEREALASELINAIEKNR